MGVIFVDSMTIVKSVFFLFIRSLSIVVVTLPLLACTSWSANLNSSTPKLNWWTTEPWTIKSNTWLKNTMYHSGDVTIDKDACLIIQSTGDWHHGGTLTNYGTMYIYGNGIFDLNGVKLTKDPQNSAKTILPNDLTAPENQQKGKLINNGKISNFNTSQTIASLVDPSSTGTVTDLSSVTNAPIETIISTPALAEFAAALEIGASTGITANPIEDIQTNPDTNEPTVDLSVAAVYNLTAQTGTITIDCREDDKLIAASLYSVNGLILSNDTYSMPAVNSSLVINKIGENTLTLTGDSVWYCGVLNVLAGIVNASAPSSSPSGQVTVSNDGTYITGGVANMFSSPIIQLSDNATLRIVVNTVSTNSDLLGAKKLGTPNAAGATLGGTVSGTENTTVECSSGPITITADCSGFTGTWETQEGTTLANTPASGAPFTGTVSAQGNSTIKDDNGSASLTVTEGTVHLTQLTTSTAPVIDSLTVQSNAEVNNEYVSSTTYTGTTAVQGTLVETGAKDVSYEQLDVNGGILDLSNVADGHTLHAGNLRVGSGVFMMGGTNLNTFDVGSGTGGVIEVYPGRNFDFTCNLDPASGGCNKILSSNCSFAGTSSALNVEDYAVLSKPSAAQYLFKILTLTSPTAKYLPIILSSEAANKRILGADGKTFYQLIATGGNGYVALRQGATPPTPTPTPSPEPTTVTTVTTSDNEFVNLSQGHAAGLVDATTNIYKYVNSELEDSSYNRICRVWAKTNFGNEKYKTSGNPVNDVGNEFLFGIDGKTRMLKSGLNYFISCFGDYGLDNLKYKDNKSHQNKYLFGGRAAWFSNKTSLELFGSYEFLKTKLTNVTGISPIKSNVFSIGLDAGHSFSCGKNFSIKPDILAACSYIRSSSSNMKSNVPNASLQKAKTIMNISPGVNFTIKKENFSVTAAARYHQNFGGQINGSIQNTNVCTQTIKKNYLEVGLSCKYVTKKKLSLGLGLSQACIGKQGLKVELSVGIKT